MARTSSSDPVNANEQTGEVAELRPFQRLLRLMSGRAELEQGDLAFDDSQLNDILATETMDDMWKAGNRLPIGGRDLAGVEQEVNDFVVKFSRRGDVATKFTTADGKRMYLLITSTRISESQQRPDIVLGQEFQWNTSAPDIVVRLFQAQRLGALPLECVISAIDLGEGQAVLKLTPVPKRSVRGSAE
jgi:hypothetical protein